MERRPPQPVEDYTTANLILLFVNLLWIFLVLWSTWGIGAVLILGAVLNHLVSRVDYAMRRNDPIKRMRTDRPGERP